MVVADEFWIICKNCGAVYQDMHSHLLHDKTGNAQYLYPCIECMQPIATIQRDTDNNKYAIPLSEILFRSPKSLLNYCYNDEVWPYYPPPS